MKNFNDLKNGDLVEIFDIDNNLIGTSKFRCKGKYYFNFYDFPYLKQEQS